ncbi:hypothetical protein K491DRAFT_695731 [Lophiostoma macrostomum CBS 122681]|uniref:Uncharacterized protein n=1 Tax=Lophiostoma macrostomum CBS 122681 TaxID=1314788 RepID=A0A6A6SX32_9PLEO|nr:hypothetical protein K491DRAFT_695731 [Lophiostoma macrostomum CBS 122681]
MRLHTQALRERSMYDSCRHNPTFAVAFFSKCILTSIVLRQHSFAACSRSPT